MKIQRFNIHADLPALNEWLAARELPPITRHELPEMGYIVYDRGEGIAAVFLRRIEGGNGIVDSMISNPKAQPQIRYTALEALTEHIIEQAKKTNIKKLIAFTVDESTLMRSERFGFTKIPHTIVSFEIQKKQS